MTIEAVRGGIYAGLGVGFYQLTHDDLKTPIKAGGYAHAGAEVPVSNSSSLNFELGVHGVGRTLSA